MSNDEDTDDAFGYRLVAQSHLLQSPPGFFVNRYLPVAFWQSRRNLVYVKLNRNQGAALLGDFNIWHRSMKAIAAGLAAACHRPIRQNRLVKLPQRWRRVALRISYCLSMSRPTAQKGAKTDFCCWPIASFGAESMDVGSRGRTGSLRPDAGWTACDPSATSATCRDNAFGFAFRSYRGNSSEA